MPDQLTCDLMLNSIKHHDAARLILDGFPRTVPQAEELDRHLSLDIVFHLDVPGEQESRRAVALCEMTRHDMARTHATMSACEYSSTHIARYLRPFTLSLSLPHCLFSAYRRGDRCANGSPPYSSWKWTYLPPHVQPPN